MKEIQRDFENARVEAAVAIINLVKEDYQNFELINALSDLLKANEYHPVVIEEGQKVAITLLEICKEDGDPQLISATANLTESFKG